MQKVKKTFQGADILDVTVVCNEKKGGDSGHGGFLEINLISTNQFYLNGKKSYNLNLVVSGDSERQNIRDAFEFISDYLKQQLL